MQEASPFFHMPDTSRRELILTAWNGLKSATWLMRTRIIRKLGVAVPTPAQMGVLQTLLSGEEAMTPRELSGCLHITPATVTGNLNALEDDGLIERVRTRDDRRVVHIRLTPIGREKVKKWRTVFEGELQEHFASLNEDELRQLASLLARLSPPSQRTRPRRET
jgi:DNA-binding MarR family transcriptional regulator